MTRTSSRDATALLPAFLVIAIIAWWAANDGGYASTDWLIGGVFIVALTATVVVALGPLARAPSRAALSALVLLVLYAAWSMLSTTWAEAPGEAYDGGLRAVVYAAVFALFVVLPWTPRSAFGTVLAFVAAIAVLGIVVAVRVVTSDDLSTVFLTARLAEPLDYHNANAALWTLAALPALVLAGSRATPAILRPVLLGVATLLGGLALMGLSRGWLAGMVAAALVMVAVGPSRLRLALFALLPVGALLAVSGELFEPYRVASALQPAEAAVALAGPAEAAIRALLLATVAVVVAGALLVLADLRLFPDRPVRRVPAVPRGLRLAAVGVVAVLIVGGAAAADAPDRAKDAWADLREGGQPGSDPGSRFTSLGGSRYDIWRVAVDVWRDQPVAGLGQDNFEDAYLRGRKNQFEEARWTHSLVLRVLAHTGAVGALLFFGGLLAAVVAALRRRGAVGATGTVAGMAALIPVVVWTAHGSVDWLWEFPALSASALAMLGLAAALPGRAHDRAAPVAGGRPPLVRRGAHVAVGLSSVIVAGALGVAWVVARDVDQAGRTWPSGPTQALDRLDRAQTLAPLDAEPAIVEGVVAHRTGDPERARRAFTEATRRAPQNWFPRFALGLLASERGRQDVAERHLRAASRLTPTEPLVRDAIRRVRSPRPVTFAETRLVIGRRVAARTGSR